MSINKSNLSVESTTEPICPFDFSAEREEAERRAKGKKFATAHSLSTTGETDWGETEDGSTPFRSEKAAHALDNDLEHPDSDRLAYSTPSATRKQYSREKRNSIRLVYTGFADLLPLFVTEARVVEAVQAMEIPTELAPYGGLRLATVAAIIRVWRERASDDAIYTEEFRALAKDEFEDAQVKWSACLSKAFELAGDA